MVEHNSDKNISCILCPNDTRKKLSIANCIGCKDVFCFDHLIQHRRDLTNHIDELIQQHRDIKINSINKLHVDQHLQYIDKWENETIELIHQHTKDVKEKILSIFNKYKFELEQNHILLEKELISKRVSNNFFERDIMDFSQQIKQLNKEIHHVESVLHNISVNELNQIVNKYKLLNKIGK